MSDSVLFQTSGSTGAPHLVAISQAALDWSAAATHAYLGGPGRWVLAVPPAHVAGTQVLNRARLARSAGIPSPLVSAGRFSVPELVSALQTVFSLPPAPVYISLVPTELFTIFNSPDELRLPALDLLARCSAILVGGAAFDPSLRDDALAHGLPIVTTYGMTETSGGCVYDGIPLPGVSVRLHLPDTDGIGIIELSGPMLADGYLLSVEEPPRGVSKPQDWSTFYTENGTRWFRTSDLGRFLPDGKLEVIGRADDVIVTGGLNIHPHLVEDAVSIAWHTLTGREAQVAVTGQPHPKWGQEIVAIIEHPAPLPDTQVSDLKAKVRELIGPIATPKQIITTPDLPKLPTGKKDRKSLAKLLTLNRS